MKTKKFKEKRTAIIEPKGDLTSAKIAELEQCFYTLIRERYVRLILNMEKVEHINYFCFKNMIEESETIRNFQGELFVVGVNSYLLSILQLVGAEDFFQVCCSNSPEICLSSSAAINEH